MDPRYTSSARLSPLIAPHKIKRVIRHNHTISESWKTQQHFFGGRQSCREAAVQLLKVGLVLCHQHVALLQQECYNLASECRFSEHVTSPHEKQLQLFETATWERTWNDNWVAKTGPSFLKWSVFFNIVLWLHHLNVKIDGCETTNTVAFAALRKTHKPFTLYISVKEGILFKKMAAKNVAPCHERRMLILGTHWFV